MESLKDKLENMKKKYISRTYGLVVVATFLGNFCFSIGLLDRFYQLYIIKVILHLTELGISSGVLILPLIDKKVEAFGVVASSEKINLTKAKWFFRFIAIIAAFLAFVNGGSIAKRSSENGALYETNVVNDNITDIDTYDFELLVNSCYVQVMVRLSTNSESYFEISELDIKNYSIESYHIDKRILLESDVLEFDWHYPLSYFYSMIKYKKVDKYKLMVTIETTSQPQTEIKTTTPPETTTIIPLTETTASINPTPTTSADYGENQCTNNSNSILVVVDEALVKNGNELLYKAKDDIGVTREFIINTDKETYKKKIKSSESGFIINSEEKIYSVKWNNTERNVNENNEVYFEMFDKYSFCLTEDKLQALFDQKGISYCNGIFDITISEINGISTPKSVTVPINMSTTGSRILYHYNDEKNDLYFTISTNSGNYYYISYEDKKNIDRFNLLCEISVK